MSTILKQIFHHVIRTLQDLPVRPVVLLSGDGEQKQPIAENDPNRTVKTQSVLHDDSFYKLVCQHKLVTQYRCEDQEYGDLFNHLRYHRPPERLLD